MFYGKTCAESRSFVVIVLTRSGFGGGGRGGGGGKRFTSSSDTEFWPKKLNWMRIKIIIRRISV